MIDTLERLDLIGLSDEKRDLFVYLLAEEDIELLPAETITSLLTEEEQRQLAEWNATNADYPRDASIQQLFEAQVGHTPDVIAVVFDGAHLSYRELNRRANQLAHHLRALGVGSETLVGICMERSLDIMIALLGVLKAGGAYLPLDPSYPRERIAFMLEDSGATVVLTMDNDSETRKQGDKELDDLYVSLSPGLLVSRTVVDLGADWAQIAQAPDGDPDPVAGADNLAYVMYTSGSTGRPKGIGIPQRAIARLVCNTNYVSVSANDRVAQVANASFDAATFEIWSALLHGALLVGITHQIALTPQEFAAQLRAQAIDVLFLTTALFHLLAREVPWAFRSVGQVLVGGEAMEGRATQAVLREGGPRRLLNMYGPTECTTFATWYPAQPDVDVEGILPIGRPIANTQLYVLDRNWQPLPSGVAGELVIGGDGLARSYLGRPELTAERFIPNPFADCKLQIADCRLADSSICNLQSTICNRLYRTGDLARFRPDGTLEYLGRIDQQVKIRGFRIELGEIEAVLGRHSAVREAVVLVHEDTPGEKRLVAYIVPTNGERRTTNDEDADSLLVVGRWSLVGELREFLSDKLPHYMIPSSFVLLDRLPLTPNGKLDRRALQANSPLQPDAAASYVAPRSELERMIALVWQEALRVEKVGVKDNFFDLGGHSLLMGQVHTRLKEILGQDFALIELFKYPTVSALARHLSEQKVEQLPFRQHDEQFVKMKAGKNRLKQRLEQQYRAK